jgi:hypothetical protein
MSDHQPQIQFDLKAMFAITSLIAAGLAVVVVYPLMIPPLAFGCLFACIGTFLGALRAKLFCGSHDVETLGIWGFAIGGVLGLILFFALWLADGFNL